MRHGSDFAAMAAMHELALKPIAYLRTPFAEKFGVPRQSGVVPEAEGVVEFLPEFAAAEFVRGMDAFSHVWLITAFHLNPPWTGSAVVRPPRLGGNERVGVFASRSPNRPNRLGLSVVRLLAVEPGLVSNPDYLGLALAASDVGQFWVCQDQYTWHETNYERVRLFQALLSTDPAARRAALDELAVQRVDLLVATPEAAERMRLAAGESGLYLPEGRWVWRRHEAESAGRSAR